MKELDVVMSAYLDHHYASATPEQQSLFRDLLQMPDPDLYNLLLGRTEAEDPELAYLVERLRR
jgi:succinate dehydrogenase flavin-adding protein (antitoxin of CptAB toxin-antitoxin module)